MKKNKILKEGEKVELSLSEAREILDETLGAQLRNDDRVWRGEEPTQGSISNKGTTNPVSSGLKLTQHSVMGRDPSNKIRVQTFDHNPKDDTNKNVAINALKKLGVSKWTHRDTNGKEVQDEKRL